MAENIDSDVRDILRQKSDETCVAFAVRAALRVWPDYVTYINSLDTLDGTSHAPSRALNTLRMTLDAYVAAAVSVPGTPFEHHAENAAKICDASTEVHGADPSLHLCILASLRRPVSPATSRLLHSAL
ncbi:hypothetical protein [Roseivivax halodurans]|uniref:hypothetical protein n=1 Tax=Roseivivax halodurans TaxID=93683 RepID=UPI0012F7207D|nr:hypothetical protein [Roseivivax halodurans]